jgi:hypothetical protein
MPYIVELEPGMQYLAPWSGDPGRTCVRATAKRYPTAKGARAAIAQARRWRKFPDAIVSWAELATDQPGKVK